MNNGLKQVKQLLVQSTRLSTRHLQYKDCWCSNELELERPEETVVVEDVDDDDDVVVVVGIITRDGSPLIESNETLASIVNRKLRYCSVCR